MLAVAAMNTCEDCELELFAACKCEQPDWSCAAYRSRVPSAAENAGMPLSSDEDEAQAQPQQTPQPQTRQHDGRGKYDRSSGKGVRTAWKPHVQKHMAAVKTGNVSAWLADAKRGCGKDCPQGGSCLEAVGTIRVLKVCAAESFGEAALVEDWDKITPNYTANAAWFQLAHSGRIVDQSGNVTDISYKVGDQRVCLQPWAAMRGIPPSTASTIDRMVRAGEMTWNDGTARAAADATRTLKGTLTGAATEWWMTRLGYYETITARGLILYPRDVEWATVYAEEFVPEMRLLGHNWKLPDAGAAARDDKEDAAGVRTGARAAHTRTHTHTHTAHAHTQNRKHSDASSLACQVRVMTTTRIRATAP